MADTPIEPRDVTLATLANLIRLMGAELVAGSHHDNIEIFEAAVRAHIDDISPAGCAPEVAASGRAEARRVVEAILQQVRAQWQAARMAKGDGVARRPGVFH